MIGNMIEKVQGIIFSKTSKNYTLFQSQLPENLEDLVIPVVTEQEKINLIQIPSMEEIFGTIRSMHSLRAPELDGMPMLFYKYYQNNNLSDVCYKVIKKIKPFLDRIVASNQVAFIEGMWTNGSSLIVQEVMHLQEEN